MMLSSTSTSVRLPNPPIHVTPTATLPDSTSCTPKPTRTRLLPSLSIPVAASVLLCCTPVDAGILSGFSGIESVPGPELPQIDFLQKWSERNQKRYSELDSKFKSSTVLKELLEKSKLNKERNERLIQDKYCLRGAEWGVGDCSTQGMTQEEKDDFISELKKRTGE